ncbi:hypothetical protein KIW84_044347 [Lathyrus oleraceus]|uniref:E3 ubiquitin-protein ligase UBR4-like domain-containing protein n=1 Tax=Pisum sativum TaxID=3888 RepID=A0A9D4XKU7_PEA|nr:hypothetical protein KIW84_044347 [Pisum sativum]
MSFLKHTAALEVLVSNVEAEDPQQVIDCTHCRQETTMCFINWLMDEYSALNDIIQPIQVAVQCRNINYDNLDSFLCNKCGYNKYGRFEFNFMVKPSFTFDNMQNDEDMKKGLAAIKSEPENAHRRYQQLLGFKKPLLKIVSSIGDSEIDSQQKDSVQQMMVSLPVVIAAENSESPGYNLQQNHTHSGFIQSSIDNDAIAFFRRVLLGIR